MKHFTIEELTHSDTAIGHGIANNPGAVERENLRRLAERVLDPARERLGAPIYVNSGYRCKAVNNAVGGSKTSQHLLGEAADITAGSPQLNKELFDYILKLQLPYYQLIDEYNYRWIHISYRGGKKHPTRPLWHYKG